MKTPLTLNLKLETLNFFNALVPALAPAAAGIAFAVASNAAPDKPRDPASPGGYAAAGWPQVQQNPQHTGYVPDPVFPFYLKHDIHDYWFIGYNSLWTRNFGPDTVAHNVQPIISDGRVFVPTKMGNVFALDAYTGAELWKFSVDKPIVNSVGAENGKVFLGALDGRVYSVSAENGTLLWSADCGLPGGFSTAPLLAEDKVFIGSRAGIFYAFDQASGNVEWEKDLAAPIANTAAYNTPEGQGGRVYVAAENMRCYALDSATGEKVWESLVLPGQSFKALFPVIHKDVVVLTPMMSVSYELSGVQTAAFFSYGGQHSRSYSYEGVGKNRADPAWNLYHESLVRGDMALFEREQDALAKATREKPSAQSVLFLSEADGALLPAPAQSRCCAMSGPDPAPAVDAYGTLIMPIRFFDSTFGCFDPEQMRFTAPLLFKRLSNCDEDRALSCCGPLVFIMHIMEGNAAVSGVFDIRLRNLICEIGSPARDTRLQSAVHETGSPHAVSFYDNMWFHISGHRLAAWQGAPRLTIADPGPDFQPCAGERIALKSDASDKVDEADVQWRVSASIVDHQAAVVGTGMSAEFKTEGELETLSGELLCADYTDVSYRLELWYKRVMHDMREFAISSGASGKGSVFRVDAKPLALPLRQDFSSTGAGGFRALGRHESGFAQIMEEDGNRFLVMKEARFFLPIDPASKGLLRVRMRMRFVEGGAMCGMPSDADGRPLAGVFFDTQKSVGTWGEPDTNTTWLACIDGGIAREPVPGPGNVPLGAWHLIDYALNLEARTYDVLFNGEEIMKDAAFLSADGIVGGIVFQNRRLPFVSRSADNAHKERWVCHVDDIEISLE